MVQNGILQYINPRYCEITGYSQEELLSGIDPIDLVHEDDKSVLRSLRDEWRSGIIDSFEVDVRMMQRGGGPVYTRLYGSRIGVGSKEALIGVMVDQTRQVESTEKFKRSLKSYKDLFDFVADGIFINDSGGKFLEVNDAALEMYGCNRNDLIGSDPSMLIAPDNVTKEETRTYIKAAMNREPQLFEWWGQDKKGRIFPTEVKLNRGSFSGDDVLIAIVRDITEQHSQKETLRQNEELFRQLFRNAPIGIALLDNENNTLMANSGFEEIFGYSEEDILGMNLDDLIVPAVRIEEAQRLSVSREPFDLSSVRMDKEG